MPIPTACRRRWPPLPTPISRWAALSLSAQRRSPCWPSQQPAGYATAPRRPPILFLRAFRDDQVSLAAARLPLLMRLIDPGSIGGSLEELIVQEYTGLGPVVAIGARPIRCCRLV